MAYSQHVRRDWDRFIIDGSGRIMSLCGSRVKIEFTGIPGVTKPVRSWCGDCLAVLSDAIKHWYSHPPETTNATTYNHAVVAAELIRQPGNHRVDLHRYVPLYVPSFRPLWDRRSQTSDNRLFLVWSSLIDRCMDRTNPQYGEWGGAGWTVCDRWISFDNFVNDMPDDFTASSRHVVVPNGLSKSLGPKSTLVVEKS